MILKPTSLLSVSAIAFSALFLASSCKKDNGPTGAAAQLSATIGANSFSPSLVQGVDDGILTNVAGLQIKSGDSLFLTVSIPDTAKAGTVVKFSAEDDGQIAFVNSKATMAYLSWTGASHGTITINSWDKTNKKISGSVSGTLYNEFNDNDSAKISGQFNTAYVTQ
jgi:VCBS repeat-containing protein